MKWTERIRGAWTGFWSPGLPNQAQNAETPEPIQWEYPLLYNTTWSPRRDTGEQILSFQELRNFSRHYDIAAICIAARMEELQGINWAIVPKDKARKDELEAACNSVRDFFKKPDKSQQWSSWLTQLVYELFTTDAISIYKRMNRGGKLYALSLIDGSTIKPLLDPLGATVGYQQIFRGVPRAIYRDSGVDFESDVPFLTDAEIMYKPRWKKVYSPYGEPPVEKAILRVKMALRKAKSDLAHFEDGNIPEGFMIPPNNVRPEQVEKFEEAFNIVLSGNDAERRKIKFLPWDAKYVPLRPFSFETDFDLLMLRITCAAFGVTPSEIGFVEDVNRATANQQSEVNERRGLIPLCEWLKDEILDPIIQSDLEQPELEFKWLFRKRQNRTEDANADAVYLDRGVVTPDEIRVMRYGDEVVGAAPAPNAPVISEEDNNEVEALAKKAKDEERREQLEKEAKKVFGKAYGAQHKRIKAVLVKADDDWREQLEVVWRGDEKLVSQAVLPFFDEVLREAAGRSEMTLDVLLDWDVVNGDVIELADKLANEFSVGMVRTSRSQTIKTIGLWHQAGGTMPQLIERVSKVWDGRRPDIAAITETTNLISRGQLLGYQKSGVVKGWRWLTASDKRVCPICQAKNGKKFKLDDAASLPAGHAGCRCDIAPIVISASEIR